MGYRLYCRIATVIFLLFTLYPLAVKIIRVGSPATGLHGVVHLASAALAGYAAWFAR